MSTESLPSQRALLLSSSYDSKPDYPATTGTRKFKVAAAVGALATLVSATAIAETNLAFMGVAAAGFAATIPVAGWVAIGVAGLILGGISLAILLKRHPHCLKAIATFGSITIVAAATALLASLAAFKGTAAVIAAAIPIGGWIALCIAGFVIAGVACKILLNRKCRKCDDLTKNDKIAALAVTAIAITVALLKTATLVAIGGFIASGGWVLIPAALIALAAYKCCSRAPTTSPALEREVYLDNSDASESE